MGRSLCGVYVVIAAMLLSACSSASDDPRRRCAQLRDHLIDLRLQGLATPSSDGQRSQAARDIESHRAALKRALGDSFVEACQAKMTPAQVTCALGAHDTAAASACSE